MVTLNFTFEEMISVSLQEKKHLPPYDLLLLADPSREMVDSYLKNGCCYVAKKNNHIVGVMVLIEVTADTLEIKNIAVQQTEQRKGIGKLLLNHAEQVCGEKHYSKLKIATGNSSIAQLALYQKQGFEIEGIDRNFFVRNYAGPIFENGIQCKHLITLEKTIS